MPADLFYWVLNMSLLGTGAGLLVLLVRRVRRLPRFGIYLLWVLPLLRFWVPVGVATRFSLLNLLSRAATKTVVVWQAQAVPITMFNSIMAATEYFPIAYKTNLLQSFFTVCGYVWALGAAAAVLCAFVLYFLAKRENKNALHIKENVYCSGKIAAPAVYGIIRPRILVPRGISEKHLAHVLLHEKVHIRRKDNLWRMLAVITACVHWFNPFAWIFLKCFLADMELACDAAVLKGLKQEERGEYAKALLAFSAPKTRYASAFGGVKTRRRIENILSYKKLTVVSGVLFSLLWAVIALTVISNAAGG